MKSWAANMIVNVNVRFPVYCSAWLLAIVGALTTTTSVFADRPAITYLVDLSNAKNHYVSVEMRFQPEQASEEIMMAVWTPGSYLVREFARHVDSMQVVRDGKELPFEKIRKNRWRIQCGQGDGMVSVKYRLYCNELSVRTNYVCNSYAILNGAPTFITLPGERNSFHQVTLLMPKKWEQSASSMVIPDVQEPQTYLAASFDELVDSPIVAGNVRTYQFEAGGVSHQLVNIGESGYWDGDKAAKDLKRLVEAHQEFWGTVPYDRYLFLNGITGGRGGLEHDFSTLMMTDRWAFRDQERYQSWLTLASHEFFHTWNVRRLRPKSLLNYDYENETYTQSLWVCEGITSYYELLLLVQAGLLTEEEFLKRLSKEIQSVQSSEGRLMQSLKNSSFDAWIKFYRPDENSSNTRVSYYSKGAVVAFLLDAKIREVTEGRKNLGDVLRFMFEHYRDSGFRSVDFRTVASEIAGVDLSDWFHEHVDTAKELNYEPALNTLGICFEDDIAPADQEAVAEDRWVGFKLSGNVVSKVQANSPAAASGVNVNDELIGINGFRFRGELEPRIKQYDIGETIQLLLARKDALIHLDLEIGAKRTRTWSLVKNENPSDRQNDQFHQWLGN